MVGGTDIANALLHNVYPSPATEVVHVLLNNIKDETVSILLTDIKGSRLIDQTVFRKQGINIYSLDVRSFAASTYFITVSTNDKKETKQIVVTR